MKLPKSTSPTSDIKSGDHVSLFYDAPEQRWQLLAEYLRDGFEQHELCIFVSQATPRQVTAYLHEAGLDIEPYVKRQDLRIFNIDSAYLPEGRFVADYMLNNVANFIEDAEVQGYKGLRTAGEMNWLAGRPAYRQEAAVYESDVNHLSQAHHSFTGLCLYEVGIDSLDTVKQTLRTHPVFIYEGELHHNPYYMAPANFMDFVAEGIPGDEFEALADTFNSVSKHSDATNFSPADFAIRKLFARAAAA